MSPQPGILFVTMAPKPSLPVSQFHDWYNNEHGPLRLRLPYVTNGFRYRASDLDGPGNGKAEWMAVYDITNMEEMTKEQYTRLRKEPVQTQRERDIMKQIKVERTFYDLAGEWVTDEFKPIEQLGAKEEDKISVLVAVHMVVKPGEENLQNILDWYNKEHFELLAKVPGYRRGRIFKTSSIDSQDLVRTVSLHEYAPENGLGGPEFQAAVTTPWRDEVFYNRILDKNRRVYDLYYTFGPAPRDLASPADPKSLPSWSYSDSLTRTSRSGPTGPFLESYVTTSDGAILPYRLEGSKDPEAPLIALSNSVLVTWSIWDDFVSAFLSKPANQQYRILRYNTRGRTNNTGLQNVTIDVLAADIVALLNALRVPRAAALIGVSLGGATVLNAALKYPSRIDAFIACDTNAKSPEGNSKAWGERIAVAEKQAAKASTGEALVGSELAELTVRRWFVPETYDTAEGKQLAERLSKSVEQNSLEGFKKVVQALYSYDVEGQMRGSKVKGLFVAGKGDGKLPETMADMATKYSEVGTQLAIVNGAGHLPMVEKPKDFTGVVENLLGL